VNLRTVLLSLVIPLLTSFSIFAEADTTVLEEANTSGLPFLGYKTLVTDGESYLAAGTEGRIDKLSAEGGIIRSQRIPNTTLTDLLICENLCVASGEKGFLLFSTNDGPFVNVESGTSSDLHSLAFFKGKILVGCDDGILLVGDKAGKFQKKQMPLLGKIVSLSANEKVCYGVTDKGEITYTKDGINWTLFDFNEFYAGYYKPCRFTQVLVTDTRIAAIGVHQDDTPALVFSTEGTVWTEQGFNYTDESNASGVLDATPNNLTYDPTNDQFFICCNTGKLLLVPACSHCNKLIECGEANLFGIAITPSGLLVAGQNYFVKSMVY
jgi:hypothetical protein